MEFRKDINGLRAWAVILVMLYHFGLSEVSGGFVGVDVFFVISGYLMTGIILSRKAKDRFSLNEFYLSRARRIVPALAAMCFVVLGFGWFWLGAADYKTLAAHIESAMLFFSNFTFTGEAGYFDAESSEKWLLHTWSLSVEWQFYLLYPLLLVWLARLLRATPNLLIPLALLGSLIYSMMLSRIEPDLAFYSIWARSWELLAGGAVYLFGKRVRAWRLSPSWLEYAGIALILIAAISVDRNQWPGPLVILPVLGAVLVLLAERQDSILTASPLMQSFGRWSYSIYLWHWPLLVAALYLGARQGLFLILTLLGASIALGALSFRFVEEPFRHTAFGRAIRWRGMAAVVLSVVIVGALIVWAKGIPARLPVELARIEEQMLIKETDVLKRMTGQSKCGWDRKAGRIIECRYGAREATPTVAVWGDSHANKAMLAVHEVAERNGIGVELYYRNACPPLQGYVSRNGNIVQDCRSFNRQVQERIATNRNLDSIMMIVNWPLYLGAAQKGEGESRIYFGENSRASLSEQHWEFYEHLVADACALTQIGKQVVIAAPLPYFGVNVPKHMAKSYIANGAAEVPFVTRKSHLERNAQLMAALDKARSQCNVEILDLLPLFCDGSLCHAARDGIPLYSDDNHLSMYGNALVQRLIEPYLKTVPN